MRADRGGASTGLLATVLASFQSGNIVEYKVMCYRSLTDVADCVPAPGQGEAPMLLPAHQPTDCAPGQPAVWRSGKKASLMA